MNKLVSCKVCDGHIGYSKAQIVNILCIECGEEEVNHSHKRAKSANKYSYHSTASISEAKEVDTAAVTYRKENRHFFSQSILTLEPGVYKAVRGNVHDVVAKPIGTYPNTEGSSLALRFELPEERRFVVYYFDDFAIIDIPDKLF